jgi:Zn finger protein HypA/HybF involved in hydrogenase expression
MRITLAEGMHYCYDCGELILDTEHESVWYCPKHAKKRGWNIIDGRRIKIENKDNTATGTQDTPTNPTESGSH